MNDAFIIPLNEGDHETGRVSTLRQARAILLLLLATVLMSPLYPSATGEHQTVAARYLAIVVVDACRPDYLQLAEIPNLRLLMANGVTYSRAWVAQLESNTPPGHATVSTGSIPRNQGVIGFGWRDPISGGMIAPTTIEAVSQGRLGEVIAASGAVTIQQLVKEVDPNAKAVAVSSDKFFAAAAMGGKYADHIVYSTRSGGTLIPAGVVGQVPPSQILDDSALRYRLPLSSEQVDAWAMDVAVRMLELQRPRVLMINLPETDESGHRTGGIIAPQVMAEVIANVDRQIGRLIEAYRRLGIFDQTLFVVTADHGMIPNTRNVRGALIRGAVEKTGTTAIAGGEYVYLKDQTRSKQAADNLASTNITGVDAAYYKAHEAGSYRYEPAALTVAKISRDLDAAYRYLLSSYAGPTSPDVTAVLDENTMVGEQALNSRGTHGGLSWNVQHIPLILAGPGVKKGYASEMPARLVDVAPTALSVMGIPSRRMDGIVLADAIESGSPSQLNSQADLARTLRPLQDALITKSQQDLAKIRGQSQVTIELDFSKITGRIRSLQGVNAGPLPQRPGEAQLHNQYKQLGVDYVRTHDVRGAFDINVVFPNMEADPMKESSYDFKSTDLQVEAIRSVGAKVFYRLGYSWGGPSDVPADYGKFAEICKHIVMHYNDGWANGFRYGIRYWEIWNEPDIKIFWKGTPEQYFKLYENTANAIKTLDQSLKVGGPALAGNRAFLTNFLRFCKTSNSPIDFVSWHIYTQGKAPNLVPEAAREIQGLMKQYGFEKAENILSEWNIYADSADHDEFWNARGAAWTTSVLIYLQDTPVTVSLRYRGNGGERGGRGFGLFYNNGEFKKTAYSFLAMKHMLETPLRPVSNASNDLGFCTLAGMSEEGNLVRILVSDYDSTCSGLVLTVKNVPWQSRTVRLEVHLIDAKSNLTLVDKSEQTRVEPITVSRQMVPSSVYLITLRPGEERVQTTTTTQKEQGGRFISLAIGSVALIAITVTVLVILRKIRLNRP